MGTPRGFPPEQTQWSIRYTVDSRKCLIKSVFRLYATQCSEHRVTGHKRAYESDFSVQWSWLKMLLGPIVCGVFMGQDKKGRPWGPYGLHFGKMGYGPLWEGPIWWSRCLNCGLATFDSRSYSFQFCSQWVILKC